ncbi:MAG: hypothetical protein EXR93_03035 [Gemmatimonadetes bacterium]|nr:hypothetical protein [Gemmatimonadota bacterium]
MIRFPWSSLLAAGAGVALCATLVRAQSVAPDTVTLRGTIVAAGTVTPLPFSVVELVTSYAQRFTDQLGAFTFSGLVPGRYRLKVRQIGYRPVDTTLTITAGEGPISIPMLRLAIRLAAMSVTGRTTCERPGLPDPSLNPDLSAVFDLLLENARRFKLLADAYPYRSNTLRTFTTVDRQNRHQVTAVDTLLRESWTRWDYRPGQVVGPPDLDNEMMVRLPTLRDFADSAFVNAHCFWLVGRDTLEGAGYMRIDFAPTASMTFPDVQGTAYLDSLTYQLRFLALRLTRAERVNKDAGLAATARFQEVLPGIPVVDRVRSVQAYLPRAVRRDRALPLSRIEEQRLLSINFLRPIDPNP